MLKGHVILYGLIMAGIDTFMLSLIKYVNITGLKSIMLMIIPTIVYSLQPWIFLSALKGETMTAMNLVWDLLSDVFVSLIGVFYYGEKIGPIRMAGLFLAMISLGLLAWKEDLD